MSKFKTVLEALTTSINEMVHYPSDNMVFQKDNKFIDVSMDNIMRMHVIKQTDEYLFTMSCVTGYIFDLIDLKEAHAGSGKVKPVLHVSLRDSVEGFKQAHNLRIRESHSGNNLAQEWYLNYINQIQPIVSDKDHLEGGYRLWKAFIKIASKNPQYNIKMVDTNTGDVVIDEITTDTPEDQIWSRHTKDNKDQSKANLVLVFRKK